MEESTEERINWLVVSNLGWIAPIIVAAYFGQTFWAVVALTMGCLSVYYHITNTRLAEYVDTGFAVIYIFVGPWMLWHVGFTHQTIFSIAIFCGAFFLYVNSIRCRILKQDAQYIVNHSLWHVCTASTTAFVYWTYFSFLVSG